MFKRLFNIVGFMLFLAVSNNSLADVKVRVWPAKTAYEADEGCLINVFLKNEGSNDITFRVQIYVEYEIDTRETLFDADVTVKAGKEETIPVTWQPAGAVLGCGVKASVLEAGKEIAGGEEYFNVVSEKKEIIRVGIAGQFRISRELNEAEKELNRFFVEEGLRGGYVNISEAHGVYDCPFSRIKPTDEDIENDFQPGGFPFSPSGTHDQIRRLRENGILTTAYSIFVPRGRPGLKLARARPDLMMRFERGQASFGQFDVKEIENEKNYIREHFDGGKILSGWIPDQLSKATMDIHIKALLDVRDYWGMDGVRWDGHVSPRYYHTTSQGKAYFNHKGEPVPPRESVDHLTSLNLKYIKDAVRDVYPDYAFMANHMWQMGGVLVKDDERSEEYASLAEGGAGICNEPFLAAYIPGNPFNSWTNMSRMLVLEADKANEYGGYVYVYPPQPSTVNPVATRLIYPVLYAARNRPWFALALYNGFMSGPHWVKEKELQYREAAVPVARFATRYSAVLFGHGMERVKEPEKFLAVQGQGEIWWRDYVHGRRLSATKRQVIVDLLNPPPDEFVKALSDEKDIPMPKKDVSLTIRVRADERVVSAHYLSPDIEGMRKELSLASDDKGSVLLYDPAAGKPVEAGRMGASAARVVVPELKYWGIVVFNVEKQ